MARIFRTGAVASVAALLALSAGWSQPGGGGGGRGMRGQGGPMMGGGMVSAEQILGSLALDPEIALTDEQLVQLRANLIQTYQIQLDLREAMRSGAIDFQEIRGEMSDLRDEILEQATAVLDEAQKKTFDANMAAMRSARGQMGGGRRQ